jgi:CheY-like chemotaxis protein
MTTVLVVDDLAVDRKLAGGLLAKNSDWSIIYATDGKQALQQLELHLPDLVLTDMQMPEMNGLELVEAMRDEFPLTPVILMTAQGSEAIAVQALKIGAASYVPKRALGHDLFDTAERVLAAAREDQSQSRLMNRLVASRASFVLENSLSLVSPLVNYLQQGLTRMRLCESSDRLRIGIAIEEALVNAFYHGNLEVSSELRETDHEAYHLLARQRSEELPYRDRRIFVKVKFSRAAAVISIRDDGPGFDPAGLPDPTDPANLEKPSGRGVMLMRTFMDEVHFNDAGNEVTLIKRRKPRRRKPAPEEGRG